MPVHKQIPYVGYIANGATSEFVIAFDLHDAASLVVTVNKEIPIVGAYSVDLASLKVVFAVAPSNGAQVELYWDTALNRDTEYKSYDNSLRPASLNFDFDSVWHVLQEQHMIDAKLLARIKAEIEWRHTHDANFDELSKIRDSQIFSGLKQYLDTILAASNPNMFDGIGAGVVFALDKKSNQTHLEKIYLQLTEGSTSVSAEKIRAKSVEEDLDTKITNEIARAINAETGLQTQINVVGVGNKAYLTYTDMDADKLNIPAKSKVTVTNDATSSNNGDWQWDGVAFTKSAYDPIAQTEKIISDLHDDLTTKISTPLSSFVLGSDDAGVAISSTTIAKTATVEFVRDQKIILKRDITKGFYLGISFSSSEDNFTAPSYHSEVSKTFVVSDKKYVRFYIRKDNNSSITLDEVLLSNSEIIIENYNINANDISLQKLRAMHETSSLVLPLDFTLGDDVSGVETASTTIAKTATIILKKGEVLTVSKPLGYTPNYWWSYALSSDGKTFSRAMWKNETSEAITITDTPYIRFYIREEGGGILNLDALKASSFIVESNSLNSERSRFLSADGSQIIITPNDFVMGSDSNGNHVTTLKTAKTKGAYLLNAGETVTIEYTTLSGLFWYSYAVSDNPHEFSKTNPPYGETRTTFVVGADKPYIRFYAQSKTNSDFTVNDLIVDGLGFDIQAGDKYVKTSELQNVIANNGKLKSDVSFLESSMSYRCPSRAAGGVVTFIDDDGRSGFIDELYPVMVAHAIPFGVAISPGLLGNAGYMTTDQVLSLNNDRKRVELQSHTWTHAGLNWTDIEEDIKYQVEATKNWFAKNGIPVDSFVYPYGADNAITQRLVSQYFTACYDFAENVVVNFETINNYLIKRAALLSASQSEITTLKGLIDTAAAENAWLIITTHSGNPDDSGAYWKGQTSLDAILELFNYANAKGCKVLKPRDAFQIYGNIVENDSGFRITANGKIIGLG
ncbi:MAG: polysaccharide deacetylase family protein [Acinetobacter sp.]